MPREEHAGLSGLMIYHAIAARAAIYTALPPFHSDDGGGI